MNDLTEEDVDVALLSARARRALIDAPDLIAHIRTLAAPSIGGAQDGMPHGKSADAPVPVRVDAVDVADELFSNLIRWVVFWASQFGRPMPVAAMMAHRREGDAINDVDVDGNLRVPHTALGFGAHVTAAGARALTETLTTWLLEDHEVIADEESATAYFAAVSDMFWRARGRFPRGPKPTRGVMPRPCPMCEKFTLAAEWGSEELRDFVIRCSFCGYEEAADAFIWEKRVRELLTDLREERGSERREWWSKHMACSEMGITIQTLNRYIQSGLQTQTVDGTVYVRSEDVQGLWREKRAAQVRSRKEAIVAKNGPEGAEHVGL